MKQRTVVLRRKNNNNNNNMNNNLSRSSRTAVSHSHLLTAFFVLSIGTICNDNPQGSSSIITTTTAFVVNVNRNKKMNYLFPSSSRQMQQQQQQQQQQRLLQSFFAAKKDDNDSSSSSMKHNNKSVSTSSNTSISSSSSRRSRGAEENKNKSNHDNDNDDDNKNLNNNKTNTNNNTNTKNKNQLLGFLLTVTIAMAGIGSIGVGPANAGFGAPGGATSSITPNLKSIETTASKVPKKTASTSSLSSSSSSPETFDLDGKKLKILIDSALDGRRLQEFSGQLDVLIENLRIDLPVFGSTSTTESTSTSETPEETETTISKRQEAILKQAEKIQELEKAENLQKQIQHQELMLTKLQNQPYWFNYFAAFVGSAISTLIMHPVDTIKTRLQISGGATATNGGFNDDDDDEDDNEDDNDNDNDNESFVVGKIETFLGSTSGVALSSLSSASSSSTSSTSQMLSSPLSSSSLTWQEVNQQDQDRYIYDDTSSDTSSVMESYSNVSTAIAMVEQQQQPRVVVNEEEMATATTMVTASSATATATTTTTMKEVVATTTTTTAHSAKTTSTSSTTTTTAETIDGNNGGGDGLYDDLYEGLTGNLWKEVPPSAVYLGVYETVKYALAPKVAPMYLLFVYLIAGAAGETVGSVIRAPAEAVKSLVQSKAKNNAWEACQSVLGTPEGRANVVRAWSSSITRDVPFGAIQLAVFEVIKAYILNNPNIELDSSTLMSEAVIGAFAGGLGAFLTNPADVITTRIITQDVTTTTTTDDHDDDDDEGIDGDENNTPLGVLEMGQKIYNEEGLDAFFTGWTARVGYWAPAISIFLTCYCSVRQAGISHDLFP